MPLWALVAIAMAVFRVVVALMLYVSGVSVPLANPLAPLWVYAALSLTFTFAGLALVVSHRQDERTEWLGALLTMIGCPLVRPLIAGGGAPPVVWLESFHPEVFTPACAWAFAASFPVPLRDGAARIVRGITFACALIAAVLVAASLALALGSGPLYSLAEALNRVPRGRVSPIWLLQIGLSAPSLLLMLSRTATAPPEAKTRVRFFIGALCAGLGPITLQLLAEGIWPAYNRFVHQPAIEPLSTAVLFIGLATLPFSMAYAVLFDRVVETHIALHAAAQYLLARYVVGLLTLIPFGGLMLYLVRHRDESLASLVSGAQRPAVLLVAAVAGALALRFRPRAIHALDRRYYREPYDGRRLLGELTDASGPSTLDELSRRVREAVDRAFHAHVDVFLLEDDLVTLRHTGPDQQSALVATSLLQLGAAAIDVQSPQGLQLRQLLRADERRWLDTAGIRHVVPISSRALGTIGAIAIGPKRSGLRYSQDDHEFLSAVAAAAGLTFDSIRLRRTHVTPAAEPAARECEGCGSVFAPETTRCRCGRTLALASAPFVLRGVFRFERRIGSGGTGVVYRAVDLALGRTVAIKVLSGRRADEVDLILREARQMVSLSHDHLAVIHSVERWREMPLLVQEHLEGGTLAHRLAASPIAVEEIAELGRVLVDVLERVHASGIVHCDVKPSNIGYTRDGVVKLFDFGLARPAAVKAVGAMAPSASVDELMSSRTFAGTPFYMSPEAIRGEPASPAFDWWSLSVVLFEAIAGRRPFEGADTPDVLSSILFRPMPQLGAYCPALPADVGAFFARAFDREQTGRPATASEFRPLLARLKSLPPPLTGAMC